MVGKTKRIRYFRYNYYLVSVPPDAANPDSSEKEKMEYLGGLAIDIAREERAKLYCMPALWTAVPIKGDLDSFEMVFRVCRKRRV